MIKLPMPILDLPEFPAHSLARWQVLTSQAAAFAGKAGRTRSFEEMVAVIREMARSGGHAQWERVLRSRPGARALTNLWLEDEGVRSRLLRSSVLDQLVAFQQPRLSRLSLLNLIALYMARFDELDRPAGCEGLREHLQGVILSQLQKLPTTQRPTLDKDPLRALRAEGPWVLATDGPMQVAQRTQKAGQELAVSLDQLGLSGMDAGRYGDVCRAHFYLARLRALAPGAWDPVLDELLKQGVATAPYRGEECIDHEALRILIDRSGAEPFTAWQDFIITIAGDPRVSEHTTSYRRWWARLGRERVEKVQRWLSKEDLRLFLQALEEGAKEKGNEDLLRMFPERKIFLEGLYKAGLIRQSRLMLGERAEHTVRRALGKDMLSRYAKLDSSMSDKAVIFLDCGEFCLLEGSHNFKIWVYMARPSPAILDYTRDEFTRATITTGLVASYQKLHPGRQHFSTPHKGLWQGRVFSFLAEQRVQIDREMLVSPEVYRRILIEQGIPSSPVTGIPIRTSEAATEKSQATQRQTIRTPFSSLEANRLRVLIEELGHWEHEVLRHLARRSSARPSELGAVVRMDSAEVRRILVGPLHPFVTRSGDEWRVNPGIGHLLWGGQ